MDITTPLEIARFVAVITSSLTGAAAEAPSPPPAPAPVVAPASAVNPPADLSDDTTTELVIELPELEPPHTTCLNPDGHHAHVNTAALAVGGWHACWPIGNTPLVEYLPAPASVVVETGSDPDEPSDYQPIDDPDIVIDQAPTPDPSGEAAELDATEQVTEDVAAIETDGTGNREVGAGWLCDNITTTVDVVCTLKED